MENLWEMIAKARGVELDEEFLFSWNNFTYKYRIRECGLEYFKNGLWFDAKCVDEFIRGIGEIERLPFRPQRTEVYYTIMYHNTTGSYHWGDTTSDFERLIAGVVFRTREEAEDYIPTWIERINKL